MVLALVLGLLSLVPWEDPDPPLALIGADVLVAPGEPRLAGATVLVRDGRIEAVGTDLALPFDARAVDVSGLVLMPGFADAASQPALSFPEHRMEQGRPLDTGRDVATGMPEGTRLGLAPERRAADVLPADAAAAKEAREAGFTALVVAPDGQLLAGQGAWLTLSGRPPREAVLDDAAAQFGSLLWRSGPENYEGNRYPATLMGAMAHLRQLLLDAQHDLALSADEAARRPADPALAALAPVLRGELPLVLRARSEEDVRLVLGLAEDFPGLRVVIAGGLEAYELAPELAARGIGVIHDLDFGDEPEDPDAKPGRKKKAKDEGEEGAAGKEEPQEGAKLWDPPLPQRWLRDQHRRWSERVAGVNVLADAGVPLAFGSFGRKPGELVSGARRAIEKGGLDTAEALAGLSSGAQRVLGGPGPTGRIEAGAPAFLAAIEGEPLDKKARVRVLVADGVLVDLRRLHATAPKEDEDEKQEDEKEGDESVTAAAAPAVDWPVEIDEDRVPALGTGGDVLVTGATLLVTSRGELADHDLLVLDGRIAAIGQGLSAPEGCAVVDAAGQYLMPGVIDCHSHMAIRGGINEWTRIATPEVTIEDEVNPDDLSIWRALAGGVTTCRLLHGSSNAIGGRHEVIKLRWGASAPEMVFAGAPRGVKFALGENPKRSNASTRDRFPETRMGVEAVLRRSFEDARRYAVGRAAGDVRRDLRLEALAGILDGSIRVHSHCYRADEILMLIALGEEFGFQVDTFQHVLEGYRVGPEIAAHGGLGGSTFVDWWAYKAEAYDATPYNPALMHEAGVLVSVNSDSDEHCRRLYLEAAKCVKYGDMPVDEALATVTLNPARQLGVAERVGSLEVGKDADFALYSRHPFDTTTVCLKTFVDGEQLFERRAGVYDDWMAEVARRVVAEPAEPETPAAARPALLDERLRQAEASDLSRLALPGSGTRAASTPARPAPEAIALVGGTVHTLEREGEGWLVHSPGVVTVRDGRISGVYEGSEAPPGHAVIDVRGAHVWPGLVDAGSSVGLEEIESVRGTMDVSERGEGQPDLRASTGYNPASAHVPVARVNGITTALVVPGGSGPTGSSSLLALEGWTVADALVRDSVALHVATPRVNRETLDDQDEDRPSGPGGSAEVLAAGDGCMAFESGAAQDTAPGRRRGRAGAPAERDSEDGPKKRDEAKRQEKLGERLDEVWGPLRQALADAREYARAADEAARRGVAGAPYDARLAALAPYALGRKPVVFEAPYADQIVDALDFAREEGLRAVIADGRDAWKVADLLAAADVPVIVGPVLSLPLHDYDPYDAPLANAGLLHRAGVRVCFRSNSSADARNLPYHAAMAVAFGLPEDEALAALTSGAAEILGLGDEIGRIAPGLRADLIVTDGSPLQITTHLQRLVIGGREVTLSSKHTQLYETWRSRLADPGRSSP